MNNSTVQEKTKRIQKKKMQTLYDRLELLAHSNYFGTPLNIRAYGYDSIAVTQESDIHGGIVEAMIKEFKYVHFVFGELVISDE